MARPLAQDHYEKRSAILETAARFFAENGFDRASMSQLAIECGVSKALIYHYYRSKEALLFDILHRHLSQLRDAVCAVTGTSDDPSEELTQLVHAILTNYRGADSEHRLQMEAMRHLAGQQQRKLTQVQREIVSRVSLTVARIDPDRFLNENDQLHAVTMALFGMLNWFYLWHRPGKGLSREAYAELAAKIFLHGIQQHASG